SEDDGCEHAEARTAMHQGAANSRNAKWRCLQHCEYSAGVSDPLPEASEDSALTERVREAAETLEKIVADRGLLARLTADERQRLIRAAGHVYAPDNRARRRMIKAKVRRRNAEVTARDEALLAETGIRALRRQPVFNTPNVFPPEGFTDEEEPREALEARNCYVCKQDYTRHHHFYDQMCPPCAELNFQKRGELADLSGRVASS